MKSTMITYEVLENTKEIRDVKLKQTFYYASDRVGTMKLMAVSLSTKEKRISLLFSIFIILKICCAAPIYMMMTTLTFGRVVSILV